MLGCQLYCPIKGVGPNSPSDNNYKGGFATALMYKDLGLAIDAATQTNSEVNYGLPNLQESHENGEKTIKVI